MPKESSKNIQLKLDSLLQNVGDMSLKRRAKKIIEDMALKDGDEILDIGCGDGYFLHLLSNLPVKVNLTGIDNARVVLGNARINLKSNKIKFVLGSATEMPFEKKSFKKAIMTEVLEHIDDDKKALSEAFRVLKSKGVLLLTVPSYNFPFLWDPINWILQNIFGIHISGTNFFAGIWARHIRLYKRKNLEKLIKDVGFKIVEIEELTSRCLLFNHYLVNLVARFLYDVKPTGKIADSLSKFKVANKPLVIKLAFFLVNTIDKVNDIFPGKRGLNIYVKAKK